MPLELKFGKEIENDEYQLLVDDCNRTISKLNEEKMLIKKTLSKKQSDLNFNELNKKLEDFMKNPTLDRKIIHKLIERIEILEDGSPRIYYRFSNPYMSSIFLRATNSTPRGLRGQNECHVSMIVLGNIFTAFLALSVDGNISSGF